MTVIVHIVNAVKYHMLPITNQLDNHNHRLVKAKPENENVLTVWNVVSIFFIVAV